MHIEVFNKNQIQLLPLIKQFKREYFLVGGTAIALYLGHRRSIDFDLFKFSAIKPVNIINIISASGYKYSVTRRVAEQLNVTVDNVKVTFFQYPFRISTPRKFQDIVKMPGLLDLAAMKAYALGRRSKWKDYVDLYFLINYQFSIEQISQRATEIFGELFSEKLFIAQLCYFDDIDYTEAVDYMAQSVGESEIKSFLVEKAMEFLSPD
jgi:predicted nucleotidyltransferase component of viral defense system